MDTLFYHLLNMGITAVLIGLPVCLLRRFRQVPRFLVHLAWAFVGIRLVEDCSLSVRDGALVVDVLPYGSTDPGSLENRVTRWLALNDGKLVLVPMDAQH